MVINNLNLLEKSFRKNMLNKDFESFKKTHPTLLKTILEAMNEQKHIGIRDIDDKLIHIGDKVSFSYGFTTPVIGTGIIKINENNEFYIEWDGEIIPLKHSKLMLSTLKIIE